MRAAGQDRQPAGRLVIVSLHIGAEGTDQMHVPGRPEYTLEARQRSASIEAVATIPSTLRASSASSVIECVRLQLS